MTKTRAVCKRCNNLRYVRRGYCYPCFKKEVKDGTIKWNKDPDAYDNEIARRVELYRQQVGDDNSGKIAFLPGVSKEELV